MPLYGGSCPPCACVRCASAYASSSMWSSERAEAARSSVVAAPSCWMMRCCLQVRECRLDVRECWRDCESVSVTWRARGAAPGESSAVRLLAGRGRLGESLGSLRPVLEVRAASSRRRFVWGGESGRERYVCGGALRLSGFVISRVRERPEWRRVLAPARGRGRRLGRISGQRWGARPAVHSKRS